MANEKLQINIPVSGMKNATQRRTRTFLCCSCLGPRESMSDSAITVTLGKYDECEYVVEKLAIKRIPTRLLANEEIVPGNVEKNPSDTTTQSIHLDDSEDTCKKKPTGITFSSYYKMVPNKPSPDKIPKMRERTESSIITLSDSKSLTKNDCEFNANYDMKRYKTLERNYGNEWEFNSYNNNDGHSNFPTKTHIRELQKFHPSIVDNTVVETDYDIMHDRDDGKYLEPIDEKATVNIDPLTKKTLQILGGAQAGENIHRYYHNFSKGPVRCFGHPGIANKYINIEDCNQEPITMNVKNNYDIDTDDISTTSTNARQRLKWKILIKHHDKNKRNNNSPSLESTTDMCSDSEF